MKSLKLTVKTSLDSFAKALLIALLKRRLRKAYRAYQNDLSQYSCGASIAEQVSPSVGRLKQLINDTLDELAKHDPNTPTTRF